MESKWKQTIDGQWQLFGNLNSTTQFKEGVYKANAKTAGDSKLEENPEKQDISTSMSVWTPEGYGVVKQILENGYSVKIEEEKVITTNTALKKISLRIRVQDGQKRQWLDLKEISIGAKVEHIVNLLSCYLERPNFFILPMANGKQLDKKKTLQEEGLLNEGTVIVSMSSGKSKVFKRFRDMSSSYWYVGSSWDAVGFRPERPILVTGFGCYQNYYCANCSVKYHLYLQEEEVQGETIGTMTEATVKDKIGPIKFKSPIRVASGVKFTIKMMHKEVSGQSSHAFYGNSGNDAHTIEGNDNYIKVERSSMDQNCTSVDSGQVPELHYIPF